MGIVFSLRSGKKALWHFQIERGKNIAECP
jgi:hypothetical protein